MTFSWGVVHTVSPLTVIEDGSSNALPVIQSLVDPSSLTVGDMVRVELAQGGRVVVYGRTDGLGVLSGENLIINGDFRINQRDAVSGTSLGIGDYFFDRWHSTTGAATVTWTAAPQGQPVNIPSGNGIAQIVERVNMPAGTYTLSWEGDSPARLYNRGEAEPLAQPSPLTVELDGTDDVKIQFSLGSLFNVKLERGAVPTPYASRLYGEELALCQRFFWRSSTPPFGVFALGVFRTSDYKLFAPFDYPTTMRAVPTLTYSSLTTLNIDQLNVRGDTLTDLSLIAGGLGSAQILATTNSNPAWINHMPTFLKVVSGGWLAFDAEL